jgi:hypothetical protein
MEERLRQLLPDLLSRLNGPFTFRLVLQPLSAALIALRSGLRDARSGRPAYGWAVLSNPAARRELLKEGWRELSRVFIIAVIVDLIYELVVFGQIYPGQSLIVATVLALLPYPLLRGVVNRIIRRRRHALSGGTFVTVSPTSSQKK